MDEADVHAELDLFERLGLLEVATDAPVLLRWLDCLIIDPAAVGRLQQRMVEEEAEAPAPDEHSGDLADRRVDLVDVLEDEARHHRTERRITERQLVGGRPGVDDTAGAFGGGADLVPRRIDADDAVDAVEPRCEAADLSLPAPDVEDARRARQLGRRQRQDLLVVLRVGTTREPVDPPL